LRRLLQLIKGIYVILDDSFLKPDTFAMTAKEAAQLNPSAIQIRVKHHDPAVFFEIARSVKNAVAKIRNFKGLFIINDRPDIALLNKIYSVHLGQDDIPAYAARKIFDRKITVGISTHTLDEAVAAAENGADYIGFGPVFKTTTKENPRPVTGISLLMDVCKKVSVPVVAVGGINFENLKSVKDAGAHCAAMISSLYTENSFSENLAMAIEIWRK
jgi:thiamine-phosphate pyrophosphorylase